MMQQEVDAGSREYKSLFAEDLLRLELKMKESEAKLQGDIKDSKVDMIKWFMGGFIALALMLLSLYLKK